LGATNIILNESDNEYLVESQINDENDERRIPIDQEIKSQPNEDDNFINYSKFCFPPSPRATKSSSSSSKTSSPLMLRRGLNNPFKVELKTKLKLEMDKVGSSRKCNKFVSFETAERQEYYDFLFSADVASPSLEVPEIFNLFGSTSSLVNQTNHSVSEIERGNSGKSLTNTNNHNLNNIVKTPSSSFITKKNDLKEHIPLPGIFTKRNKFLNKKSVSGDDS
jgi:hypothetical protein